MKNLILLGLLFLLLPGSPATAQVATVYNPAAAVTGKGRYNKPYTIQVIDLPAPDSGRLAQKDSAYNASGYVRPFRIAEPVPLHINVAEAADWVYDGRFAYGRLDIRIKKAKSLSINFGTFVLPEQTSLYIYNREGSMVTGPVTEKENNPGKVWGSTIYPGDRLTIEIEVPAAKKPALQLVLSNMAFGYKDFFNELDRSGFGTSGACQLNVLCPEGQGWESQRKSVALVLDGDGASVCSGVLVANACAVNTPYLLSANHCFNYGNVSQWRFLFHYWSLACTPTQHPLTTYLFNGAVMRARHEPTDFALLELAQPPLGISDIWYSGWSRSTTPPTQTATLHHPAGDVMKMAIDKDPAVRYSMVLFNRIDLYWRALWDKGAMEGKSSGAPLYDQHKRVVGQLRSGTASCADNPKHNYFGSFDKSWTGGGTNGTRLSNWLDPGNTGAITTDAVHPLALIRPTQLAIGGNSILCHGTATYTLSGVPPGTPVAWSLSDNKVATITPGTGDEVTVTKTADGTVTLTATATSGCGQAFTAQKHITLGTAGYQIVLAAGSEPLCTEPATYAITNLPAGAPVTWSTTSADISIHPATGPQTTVTPVGYSGATPTLVATLPACNNASIYRPVRVGGYTSGDYPVSGPSSAGCGDYVYYQTAALPGAVAYNWFWPAEWNYVSGQGTARLTLQIPGSVQSGGGHVGLRVANACGAGGSPALLYTQVACYGYYYSVAPNPAVSSVTVTAGTAEGKTVPRAIATVKVYDGQGNLKKQMRLNKARTATLSTGDLPAGLYFIEIGDGVYRETQRLSIIR